MTSRFRVRGIGALAGALFGSSVSSAPLVPMIADASLLQRRKKIAEDFLRRIITDRDFTAADEYLGATYIQHNPEISDGKEALLAWFGQRTKPGPTMTFRRTVAEGDIVWTNITFELKRGDGKTQRVSVAECFRFDGEKIVEHWDVRQDAVLEDSVSKHPLW